MSTQVLTNCPVTSPSAEALDNENTVISTTRKRAHEKVTPASKAENHRTIKSSKSRTGCSFCKQKRLKCDETKPECKNCMNRDRKCPGYKQVYQWKAKCQTDLRSYDGVSRKKPEATLSTPTNRLSSGRQAQPDSLENHDSGRTESQPAIRQDLTDADIMHSIDSEDLESLTMFQNCVGIDLDGLSMDGMVASRQCTALPYPELLPEEPFIFPGSYKCSEHDQPSSEAQAYLNLPHSPIESSAARRMSDANGNGLIVSSMTSAKRAGPRDIRSLLTNFYTTSPSVPFPLVHHATKLVEHYFSTICGIYSCFDSFLNPFRYTVSDSWTRSASTYYAIQSMAAAHLANDLPRMRKEGLDLHRKASQHLGKELQMYRSGKLDDDQALLSLLLLGMSASWQRPGDLGLPYLRTARSLMYNTLARRGNTGGFTTVRPLLQFFEESMVYWEMVTSFVADEIEIEVQQPFFSNDAQAESFGYVVDEDPLIATSPSASRLPHPWTGVHPESQMLLGRVGRLVRRARVMDRFLDHETHLFGLALELEENLLEAKTPPTNSMSDCGDFVTQNSDFVTLADTTRDAGLLELYRVFPALLKRRLGPQGKTTADTTAEESSRAWLTSLSINILRRLETIPESSNVRCHQLLLIVIAAAELRLSKFGETDHMEFSDLDLEVLWGRQFARARLHQLAVQLPAQPVYTVIELINEVWRRVDASGSQGLDDTFWIDVMVEKGWHTVMG